MSGYDPRRQLRAALGGLQRGRYGLTRQFLHATRLAFVHPVTGVEIDVSSPLPADLAAALETAERGE